MNTHETVIRNEPSGSFPKKLEEIEYLLVAEQPNFIPMYASGMSVGMLEATVKRARQCNDEQGEAAAQEAREDIDIVRGDVEKLTSGLLREGNRDFILIGTRFSHDRTSKDPAISPSPYDQFSFKIKPKRFNLGLTGRLLRDQKGTIFQERLSLEADIYEAYNLALDIMPLTIVGVDRQGREHVVYENGENQGKETIFENKGAKIVHLHPENKNQGPRFPGLEEHVLLPEGFEIQDPQGWGELKGRYRNCWLVGYQAENFPSFLTKSVQESEHIVWKIAQVAFEDRDPNTCMLDAESTFGLRNKVASWPYHRSRLCVFPNKVNIRVNNILIEFGQSEVYQALMTRGPSIRDIWMDPRYRKNDGWDVVHDKGRQIEPRKPLVLDTEAKLAAQQVLFS